MRIKVILLIVLLLALGIRIYCLGKWELWYDEILAIKTAQNFRLANNSYLYYTLLYYWIKFFKFSESTVRIPSLIFSMLSIASLYLLGKNLFNEKIALFSTGLLAFNPFHIWYSQEARPYSALVLCGILSSYFLFRGLKEKKILFLFPFTFLSVVGIYLHYFYITFLLVCLFIVLLFLFVKKQKYYVYWLTISILIIFLFLSPWLPRFLLNLCCIIDGFWIPVPSFKSLFITLENFNLGYNAPNWAYKYSLFLTLILFLSAINFLREKKELQSNFWLCLMLFILPILFAFFFSKFLFSIYLDRALMISSPYYYLILGIGLESIGRKKLKYFVKLSIFFLLVQSLSFYYQGITHSSLTHHTGAYVKKPIRPVINYLERRVNKNDIICIINTHVFLQFNFYKQNKGILCFYVFSPEIWDTNWNRPHSEGNNWIPVNRLIGFDSDRIWMLFSDCPRSGKLDENSQKVKSWMDKNYLTIFEQWLDGILLKLYEKK
ncbi:MAG: glycosyltransferase family 39 protein [Candidatus Omnitrophica bacterium]|nr:glycosyltransferase family 39 protein [Candidatus Omnitrophota bacterium]